MCNSFIRSIPNACIESNKQIVVCKDKGSRVEIRFNVPSQEKINTYRVAYDGCLETSSTIQKCDFLVLKTAVSASEDCKITKIAFCELKGSNVEKAIEQVFETAQRIIRTFNEEPTSSFYIKSTKVPANYKDSAAYRKLKQKYLKSEISVKSSTSIIEF